MSAAARHAAGDVTILTAVIVTVLLIALGRELWHDRIARRARPSVHRLLQTADEERLLRAWSTADSYRLLAELAALRPTYQCIRCGGTGPWLGADTEHICRSEP